MELEEAKKYLDMMDNKINFDLQGLKYGNEAIETVLKALENSIPKEVIENKIEEYSKIQEEMTYKNHNADNLNDCYKYGDEAQEAMYKKEALQEILEGK